MDLSVTHRTALLAQTVAQILPAETRDAPLRPQERLAADRLGERLHAELSGLLRSLPAESRSASGLARLLKIERTVCQRMVAALNQDTSPGAQLLTKLPGTRSLRAIVEGCKRRGGDSDRAESALAAIEVLADFFERVGGGQAVFARRLLMAPMEPAETGSQDPLRRDADAATDTLFDAACALVGRRSRVQLQAAFYRPDPDNVGMMQAARLRGFLGHAAREGALPLVTLNLRSRPGGEPVGPQGFEAMPEAGGESGTYMVPEFCSGPVGRLTSRRIPGGMVQIADPEGIDPGETYDLVAADHSVNSTTLPALDDPALHEVWASIDYPAEYLLCDVWQHRDMARNCIPSLSNHVYRLNLMDSIGERWYTNLPADERLELLGSGLRAASTPLWGRHRELLGWMFERLGWNPEDYVGYRCAVRKPRWRTAYLMSFDFRTGQV